MAKAKLTSLKSSETLVYVPTLAAVGLYDNGAWVEDKSNPIPLAAYEYLRDKVGWDMPSPSCSKADWYPESGTFPKQLKDIPMPEVVPNATVQ